MIYQNITELVGNTPLIRLNKIEAKYQLSTCLYAKLEKFNPTGSVKDRAAKAMILQAINEGKLKKGSLIIEPTSGNTGIGLAAIGNYFGFRVIIVMPSSFSFQRRKLLQSYGAELVLVEGNMTAAIKKAEELQRDNLGSFIPGQFVNPANSLAHYLTTGPEIFKDIPDVDIIVAGVGTGGTIGGITRYFKEKKHHAKIIAVEPATSNVLSGGLPHPHKIQGIGAGFIPKLYADEGVDDIISVSEEEAYLSARVLVKEEGLLVGISSGAALSAAIKLSQEKENSGKKIVIIFPDTGERYEWEE